MPSLLTAVTLPSIPGHDQPGGKKKREEIAVPALSLDDTDNGDGHNVYMQVRVEGYDWSRYNGKQKKTVHFDQLNWDGAALHTDDAYIRVCRDKGSLNPDNCSPTKHYQR